MIKSKRILFNFIILVFFTSLSVFICETILETVNYPPETWNFPWVYSDVTGYKYAPNINQMMGGAGGDYKINIKTNSLGLRDDEIKPKSGYRILLLGDSFASGYGTERGDLFADILEKRLGSDVVNAGVGGYGLAHIYHYYRETGKNFKPDLVIYAMYLGNDLMIDNVPSQLDKKTFLRTCKTADRTYKAEYKLITLYRTAMEGFYFYFYKYKNKLFAKKTQKRKPNQKNRIKGRLCKNYLVLSKKLQDKQVKTFYRNTKKFIEKLRDDVVLSGSNFLVAMFSFRTAVEEDAFGDLKANTPDFDKLYDIYIPEREMSSFFTKTGINYINLNEALRKDYKKSKTLLYYPNDGHFTKRGNEIVADTLYQILMQKNQAHFN